MEFKNETQKNCYDKVLGMMKEMFGEQVMLHKEAPKMAVTVGSALAEVMIYPWSEDESIIVTFSYVVTGAEVVPELMHFLLQENNNLLFGAFALDKDNDIVYSHSIIGSTCEKNELRASVMAVAKTADDYDNKIISRFGGQSAADRLSG